MDPIIEEINRARPGETVRPDVLKRWQQYLVREIQPRLDELDAMKQAQTATKKGAKA